MSLKTMITWKLREVMARKKMRATRLAELMGVNRVTVSKWMAADELPSFKDAPAVLNELCKSLNCHVHELIDYAPDANTSIPD